MHGSNFIRLILGFCKIALTLVCLLDTSTSIAAAIDPKGGWPGGGQHDPEATPLTATKGGWPGGGLHDPGATPLTATADIEKGFSTYQTAAIRTWRLLLKPKFIEVSKPKLRTQIEKVGFKVIRFSDFNAFANYSLYRVELPVGLLFTLDLVADAAILTWHQPQLVNKFKKYQLYLVGQYLSAVHGNKVTVKDFPEFAGIPITVALRAREDNYNLKVALIEDSLALIVGHEIGHLVLNHLPSRDLAPKDSRQQEYEADAFGMKLAMDAGFTPIAGLTTAFTIFGLIEDGGGSHGPMATHPPIACRITPLYEVAFKQIDTKEARDGMKRFGASRDSMLREMAILREECEREGH